MAFGAFGGSGAFDYIDRTLAGSLYLTRTVIGKVLVVVVHVGERALANYYTGITNGISVFTGVYLDELAISTQYRISGLAHVERQWREMDIRYFGLFLRLVAGTERNDQRHAQDICYTA